MSLADGTYYIENHYTHTSIARGSSSGVIQAKKYNDLERQKFQVTGTGTTGVYTIQNENDSSYVASASVDIGANVISQNDTYNWNIAPVGENHYSITVSTQSNGPIAVQVISTDEKVPVTMGSQTGAGTQRWHFVTLS